MNDDELVNLFWEALPERIAQATESWIAHERGDAEALAEFRRLLHSIKGEAQMFGLDRASRLAEAAESLVDRIRDAKRPPGRAGDVFLSVLDAFGAMIPGALDDETTESLVSDALSACQTVIEDLPDPSEVTGALGGVASPEQPAATMSGRERDASGAQAVAVDKLEPVISELRRLYSQQALLYPQLSEIRKMLRTLLREIDPNARPERLSETIVKTLGFGQEIERRIGKLISEWSATEYISTATLDQLNDIVRAAAVVPRSRVELTINRVARSVAHGLGKEVRISVEGDVQVDGAIERRLQPVLLHLVRNAVDHGIENPAEREAAGKPREGTIAVRIDTVGDTLRIEVRDDGRGVDFERVRDKLAASDPQAAQFTDEELKRSLFKHGFSTRDEVSPVSGRGVGLDVVYDEIMTGGGDVAVESAPGHGARFLLTLPASRRVDAVLPLTCATMKVALPGTLVRYAGRLEEIFDTPKGAQTRLPGVHDGEAVPVRSLSALIAGSGRAEVGDLVVAVETARGALALTVDDYAPPRPLVTQPVASPLVKSPLIQAVAPTPDGELLLLLDVAALYDAALRGEVRAGQAPTRSGKKHVMVVEDAAVARGLLVSMLRSFGLRVTEAMDGALARQRALADPPDLVLTDLEMPVMDGFELIDALRDSPETAAVPIVILSTRDDPDTLAWAEARGVYRFLPKRQFEESKLRDLVREIFGD